MTLTQYKEANRMRWHDVARELSMQGSGPIYENRLNRLREGKSRPTIAEQAALYQMTGGEVDSYSATE